MIKGLKWIGTIALLAVPSSLILGYLELISIQSTLLFALSFVLVSIQSYSLLWSKQGIIRVFLYVLTVVQFTLILGFISEIIALKHSWNYNFSIAITSFSLGLISSTLGNKFSPIYYMFMYVLIAICAFSLIALPISNFSTSLLLIGLILLVVSNLWLYRLEFKKRKGIH